MGDLSREDEDDKNGEYDERNHIVYNYIKAGRALSYREMSW